MFQKYGTTKVPRIALYRRKKVSDLKRLQSTATSTTMKDSELFKRAKRHSKLNFDDIKNFENNNNHTFKVRSIIPPFLIKILDQKSREPN